MLIINCRIFDGRLLFAISQGETKEIEKSIRVSGNSRTFKIFVALATLLSSAWVPADQRVCLKSVYSSQQATTLKIQAVPFPPLFFNVFFLPVHNSLPKNMHHISVN